MEALLCFAAWWGVLDVCFDLCLWGVVLLACDLCVCGIGNFSFRLVSGCGGGWLICLRWLCLWLFARDVACLGDLGSVWFVTLQVVGMFCYFRVFYVFCESCFGVARLGCFLVGE